VRTILAASLFVIGTCISASETTPIDFRISLVATPASEEVEATYRLYDGSGARTTTDELKGGWRFEVGLAGQLKEFAPGIGLIGGAWIFYGDQEASEFEPGERELPLMTGPMEMTTLGVDLFLGLGVRLNPYLELEAGPFVGIGTASISDVGVGVEGPDSRVREKGHGEYHEAGFALAILAHNSNRSAVVGLGVRYYGAIAEADISFDVEDSQGNEHPGGLKEHVEVRQSGFAPYITAGMTF
jgi:hypothetical protein